MCDEIAIESLAVQPAQSNRRCLRQDATWLEPQIGHGMSEKNVEVQQDGVVGVLLSKRDRQVERDRRYSGAAPRRIHGGDIAV